MGDFADMAVDDSLADWGMGGHWDNGHWTEDEDGPQSGRSARSYRPIVKTCRYCGQGHLRWMRIDGGWRLHTFEGRLHSCLTTSNPEGEMR